MRFPIIFFLLLTSAYTCFSQGMVSIQHTMHTPHGNVPYDNYLVIPDNNFNMRGKSRPNSMTYDFRVVLKNDSTFSSKAKINVKDIKHHTILIKGKKEKITFSPSETKSVTRITMEGVKIPGVPTDSCWLFRTYTGKINVYSFLAELGTEYAIAIQDGVDGPIRALTKENLLEIVEYDNPKVHELIEEGSFIEAIKLYNKKK